MVLSGGSAGKASLVWDGTDASGNRAASGAYFVTVVSRTRTQTSKVILLH
jgi:flagellar hook assembly protein FlgD